MCSDDKELERESSKVEVYWLETPSLNSEGGLLNERGKLSMNGESYRLS